MIDFTVKQYNNLAKKLLQAGFVFQTFHDFIQKPAQKVVVLRHDVDKRPENSLTFAKIEHSLGIKGTYYFRIVPESFDKKIIEEIKNLGHEIGYHYEDLTLAKGNIEDAIKSFDQNLSKLRAIADVKTICMHGSPMSKWDSKKLWDKYNYHDFGIIGAPYFDVNFNTVLYLTDTGRRWDGDNVSVRDKVQKTSLQERYHFRTTFDIVKQIDTFPSQIMFTIHPQRWSDNIFLWSKELILQNIKNTIKFVLIKGIHN